MFRLLESTFFKNLKDDGYFSGDFLDKNLVIFCYLNAIQKEINDMVENWNYHKIRPSKNSECPHGRNIIMYAMPDLYQVEDHLKPIANNALRLCESKCTFKGDSACDKTIREICKILMTEFTWEFPPLNSQLCDLYLNLRREIKSELL
ncbi:hypothetical protein SNE40_022489 [Patella caerulea]|uniref:Uncharacterized protein n=1 Tax=Patella caerulea TaxID=87958 RepID=A0AAN8IVU6_PATCE